MKKYYILGVMFVLFSKSSFAQLPEEYSQIIQEARILYMEEKYRPSILKFSEAFRIAGHIGKTQDVYHSARAWARANEIDSSFVQLIRIIEDGNFIHQSTIKNDEALEGLRADERWKNLLIAMKNNEERAYAKMDMKVKSELDLLYAKILQHQQLLIEAEENYGWGSTEMRLAEERVKKIDAGNLKKVRRILDRKGWLGADVIGDKANFTLYMVMHNADVRVQERYLPMMREAYKNGNLRSISLATIEDRVALARGNKQIFGTQVRRDLKTGEYRLLPLIDPKNVETRRKSLDLGPLNEYLSHWSLAWSGEE